MQLSDFHFELPPELIAAYPQAERDASRLLELCADGRCRHHPFRAIEQLLAPGDLLVFNNTRVIPARLFGVKDSGGRVEILLERLQDEVSALAQIRASKAPRPGSQIALAPTRDGDPDGARLEVLGRSDNLFQLRFDQPILPLLDRIGHMPLPPYIDRDDVATDRERYQTVYAARDGAVAAPTAGLHFTEALLARCAAKGIDSAFVTLHVGAGTFQPVRVEDIRQHRMHSETIEVSQDVCDKVAATRARGNRVVAVGTTSVRSLESAARSGELQPFSGDSDIFIYPGYRFRCIDAMITNFHLPESTLIMLVSAFAGREAVLAAYREAVAQRYRFFSYGDAMLIHAAGDEASPSTIEERP